MRGVSILLLLLFLSALSFNCSAANSSNVVINEIAWMGTLTSANDEWIELYNQTGAEISIEGWRLKAADGSPQINLTGTIPAQSFWLLERTDDNTVLNVPADQLYTGALNNHGETLELYDSSNNLIDSAEGDTGWPTGDNNTKQTMSRFGSEQWKTSKEPGGTPKALNTFVADVADASGVRPQKAETEPQTSVASDKLFEVEPQTTELQANRELATVGEQTTQESPFFLLIAGVLAIFSGIVILILKKGLK